MWHQAQQTASVFSSTGEALVLESVNVSATVNGILLDVVLEQHFINPKQHALEITYTFPLPWQATLLDVEAVINQQKMVGTVYEKKQAEKKYEQALNEGNSAMLLESLDNGLWSLSLGNLASKESCKIKVHYVQLLRVEHGHLRVTIPTVIAPRYGQHDANIAIWQQPQTDILAAYPCQINCVVQGELANTLISSPSHEIQTRFSPQGAAISLRSKAWLDRDFVLELKELAQSSWALIANTSQQEQVVLLGLVPQVTQKQQKRIKILVDCSGSMGGGRIEAAKRSLATFIRYLHADDLFTLSRFGNSVEHLWQDLRFADSDMKKLAQHWVSRLQADMGGTEMIQALSATFNLAKEQGGDVLLITDGDINDIRKTVKGAKECGQRVFVVGIGSSAAEPLLRQLAEGTGGACEFVNDNEPVEEAINRTLLRLGQAQLKELNVLWPTETQVLWQSPLPKSVFNGDTLPIYARVKGLNLDHSIRLVGADNHENKNLGSIKAQVIDSSIEQVLERMVAKSEIETLIAASYKAQALALSLKHRLVNQLTSYCLVLERAEQDKILDLPEQVKVKHMLAAGWGGASVAATPSLLSMPMFMRRSSSPVMDCAPTMDYMEQERSIDFFNMKGDSVWDVKVWLNNQYYEGLSPLGLAKYARSYSGDYIDRVAHQTAKWPTTFKELETIGVGTAIIVWLRTVALVNMAISEEKLVQNFLLLFINPDVYEYLKGQKTPPKLSLCGTEILALWTALQGMGEDWPTCIFNLTWTDTDQVL